MVKDTLKRCLKDKMRFCVLKIIHHLCVHKEDKSGICVVQSICAGESSFLYIPPPHTNSKSSSCMSARISSWTSGEKYWETAARRTRVPMSSKFLTHKKNPTHF